jgi:hypothetical protein
MQKHIKHINILFFGIKFLIFDYNIYINIIRIFSQRSLLNLFKSDGILLIYKTIGQ